MPKKSGEFIPEKQCEAKIEKSEQISKKFEDSKMMETQTPG
jgi:hypothetical protein